MTKLKKDKMKFIENFTNKRTVYIVVGVFIFVSFVAFFTPLTKFFDMITRLVLIGLLVKEITISVNKK